MKLKMFAVSIRHELTGGIRGMDTLIWCNPIFCKKEDLKHFKYN